MEKLVEVFAFLWANRDAVLGALIALLGGIIAVALLVPGPEPEATLQKIVAFLSKFSRKAPEAPKPEAPKAPEPPQAG